MCRWIGADRVNHGTVWCLYSTLNLLAPKCGAPMVVCEATPVCHSLPDAFADGSCVCTAAHPYCRHDRDVAQRLVRQAASFR